MLNDIERGYVAAFIDGEGCVTVTKRLPRGGKNYSYRLETIIAQAARGKAALDWLQARIGGVIHATKSGNYALRLAAQDTAKLAAWIGPYSVIKQDQWKLVNAFLTTFEGRTRANGALRSDVVEARETIYRALMARHGGQGKRRQM